MAKVKIEEVPTARKFRMAVEREKEGIEDFQRRCVSFRTDLENKLDLLHKQIGLKKGPGGDDYQIFFLDFYPQHEDEIRKAVAEINKEGNIKIEFEKEKEKKRPTAHEIATEHLKKWPAAVLWTLAEMYAAGTKVPKEGVPELINAFNLALKSFEVDKDLRELTAKAIRNLKQQQKEG